MLNTERLVERERAYSVTKYVTVLFLVVSTLQHSQGVQRLTGISPMTHCTC